MNRYTVDNIGDESTLEIIETFPVPRENVQVPDDLPRDATVDVTEVEEGTRVTIEYPVDAETDVNLKEWILFKEADGDVTVKPPAESDETFSIKNSDTNYLDVSENREEDQ